MPGEHHFTGAGAIRMSPHPEGGNTMEHPGSRWINRRRFFGQAGLAVGACIGARVSEGAGERVSIVVDAADPMVAGAPVGWAVDELRRALEGRGVAAEVLPSLDRAQRGAPCVLISGPQAPSARAIQNAAGVSVPAKPESLALVPGRADGRGVLLATGRDTTGLVYALLELTDRVECGEEPARVFRPPKPLVEGPANRIRCISRAFCSDLEDKPWYNDREMWPEYFKLLMTNRFNRFNLTLGLAYDFMRNVSDCYFHFAYPFLVSVPGYDVKAVGLPDSERDRNLEMLRYISDAAAARGLQFQLGLWDHAYEWTESPNANYTHTGLTPANHGPYCRDALKLILEKCPGITGVTIRIHGESGVAEGSYDFWKMLFEGAARCGRRIEIDLHAKGIDDKMIDLAVATGQPVVVAPKYWAEHMGLPYHQASIRELERAPRENRGDLGLFNLSSGERRFTRYGYADLMKENRHHGILFRMFPGARRTLLWGDPLTAAGYGRVSSFCGSDGVDFMEPLYFKGRRGSGVPGGRCSYADAALTPRWDWQKFEYTYRVWGRNLYSPGTNPDGWRRYTRKHFARAALYAEEGLAQATRVLQIVSTVHGASGAHNRYWPEMYSNMSIVDAKAENPYPDTPSPKRFGTVSPFDPQLFLTIDETAAELLVGKASGKYTQVEAADWLEQSAAAAALNLAQAETEMGAPITAEFRRFAVDTRIQAGLGRFFGAKIRSAILWAVYDQSSDRRALEEALRLYRAARAAWAELAEVAGPVYLANISYGQEKYLSGHWKDRLPAIDEDILRMARRLDAAAPIPRQRVPEADRIGKVIRAALGAPQRSVPACRHSPPAQFTPGKPLDLVLEFPEASASLEVVLHYRHANQAETWEKADMRRDATVFKALIPGGYTNSQYPLLYYFVLRRSPDQAALFPGLDADLAGQPYYAVRRT